MWYKQHDATKDTGLGNHDNSQVHYGLASLSGWGGHAVRFRPKGQEQGMLGNGGSEEVARREDITQT